MIPPFRAVAYDVALRCPERNPVGVMDGRHDRPVEDCVSMLSQCHAHDPWVCCALFEWDCGQWGVVHCGVRLPYSVETDPASQSDTQTHAIARENVPRQFSARTCKNMLIIYPLSLRPTE